MKEFFLQEPPKLGNQYQDDAGLRLLVEQYFPKEILKSIESHFVRVGEDAVHKLWDWSKQAEAHAPEHVRFDAWGARVDQVELSQGWTNIEHYAAENGIVACGYERKQAEFSRLYQAVLLYLFHPSSAFVSCPLAMTDGAARLLELYGSPSQKKLMTRLTSRNPEQFWTAGQWMTERTGGSDVSLTETVAKKVGHHYELYGIKWFTSAVASKMAITLARVENGESGSRGLSAFCVETRLANGRWNGMEILRLKDKLGTRAMPTAELLLDGAKAEPIGDLGSGIKKISTILNITRIYNSICSIAHMRRIYALAFDYAQKRQAFGKKLIDLPLHRRTLQETENKIFGHMNLVFFVSSLLGKEETGKASEAEICALRVLTPIAKLYTGKGAMQVASEMAECFGGAGYIEDTGIPTLVRDAQVFSIWEGTTNVLSLDVLRALSGEKVFESLNAILDEKIRAASQRLSSLSALASKASKKLEQLQALISQSLPREEQESNARVWAYAIAETTIACLVLESVSRGGDTRHAQHWLG